MIEYRNLEALAAVVENKGFDKAGEALGITQSAVTQRIRQLEELTGQVLLIRSQPPAVTGAGSILLEHFRKVRLLEQELSVQAGLTDFSQLPLISLAVNADSLATWFSKVVSRYFYLSSGYLDIKSADQDVTHRLMTDGEVMGCISSMAASFRGCRKDFLGSLVYRFVSIRDFSAYHFPDGIDRDSFNAAPKLNFNRDDQLLANWAGQFFKDSKAFNNSSFVPSSEQFPIMIREGAVCGMLPDEQFKMYQSEYDLVDLSMEKPVSIPLYWHRWSISSVELDVLSRIIREEAEVSLTK